MGRRIAIVGGGVIGTSVAWHLAEREAGEIVLIERDRLGCGTTWHSAGNVTWKPTPDSDRPIAYLLDLLGRLERETGQTTGWHRTGRLFLATRTEAMRAWEQYHEDALAHGVEGALLSPREAQAHHPLLFAGALTGAWLNPRSGRLNPADLVAAYARGARDRGVIVREQCAVERLAIGDGGVEGVVTDGGTIEADVVVVCAGLWSRGLLREAGAGLAHGGCEHFYAIAQVDPPLSRDTPSFICPERLTYGREEVGRFLVGFFDRDALPIEPDDLPVPFSFSLLAERWDQIASYYEGAAELFPALTDAPIHRLLNGPESFTPDGKPLIGPIDGVDGLMVACGLCSAGVTYSAMAGHLIADEVCGSDLAFTEIDCNPNRFGEQAADRAWVDSQMPDAPSSFYLAHHR